MAANARFSKKLKKASGDSCVSLIESEEVLTSIDENGVGVEIKLPGQSKDNNAKSNRTRQEKAEMKSNRRLIKVLLVLLSCILIILMVIVWHFYHLKHEIDIELHGTIVAHFDFKDRHLVVLNNQKKVAVELSLDTEDLVSHELKHLKHCHLPAFDKACLQWKKSNTSLSITASEFDANGGMNCIKVSWNLSSIVSPLDCIQLKSFNSDLVWFDSNHYKVYPNSSSDVCTNNYLDYYPGGHNVVTPLGTVIQNTGGNVIEPLWLSTNGVLVKISCHHNIQVLYKACDNSSNPQICFKSKPDTFQQKLPEDKATFSLDYMVCIANDINTVQQETMKYFLRPTNVYDQVPEPFLDLVNTGIYYEELEDRPIQPKYDSIFKSCKSLFAKPVWSVTLPSKEHKQSYLKDIRNISGLVHVENIDNVYARVGDRNLTQDMKDFVDLAHDLGFKVMLPVTPFVNYDAKNFKVTADNKLVIFDKHDQVPALTKVAIGNDTLFPAVIDFTNPAATKWFKKEVKPDESRVDYLHIYYGHSSWLPSNYKLKNGLHNKAHFSTLVAATAFEIGKCNFVDVAFDSQIYQQFVRLTPSASLRETLSSTLAAGISGYPFVIPTYPCAMQETCKHADTAAMQDAMIRWIEMVSFFPVVHIPWDYDIIIANNISIQTLKETIEKFMEIRNGKLVGPKLEEAFAEAESNHSTPVVAPMWKAPDVVDVGVMKIEDQFMIGDDICVAPILDVGSTLRDVFLPPGVWLDYFKSSEIDAGKQHGTWLMNYHSPIGEIPLFTRK